MTEAEWITFLQRPEIPAFNRAMLVNPDDDLPRLAFADWMDENCPDMAVNAAVRESITNESRTAAWPGLQPNDVWTLSFARGRLRMRIKWVDRYPVLPPHRRPLHMVDAVWRFGWIEAIGFGRGQFNALTGWFDHPAMGGVVALEIDCALLFPNHLRQLLASPALSSVTSLTLDGWRSGSDIAGVLGKSPLTPRLRELQLDCSPLDLYAVSNLVELPALSGLEVLSLTSCEISEEGAGEIAYSPYLVNLKHLNLNHNRIRDLGAAALANSPYLCEAIRAQWRRPTDEGGANR